MKPERLPDIFKRRALSLDEDLRDLICFARLALELAEAVQALIEWQLQPQIYRVSELARRSQRMKGSLAALRDAGFVE